MNSKKLLLIMFVLIFALTTFVNANPGNLTVHFIDVGQADSILVQTPTGANMLIDAGNNDDGAIISSYLNRKGVKRLDVLIGTHPHEDHIGGMDVIIRQYSIGKIHMPKVTTTTRTFEDVLQAVKEKGLKISASRGGANIELDPAINVAILAPNGSHYKDLNNYSIVLKITYGKTSFLLTGDAERESEKEMLDRYKLKADVLKVGHHGSNSSTSAAFLKAVSPKYAVISVGKNNDYGHPKQVILNRLKRAGVKVYRTDRNGTIIAVSNGETVTIKGSK